MNNYLDGISIIYWINLERAVDRREKMVSMFHDDVFENIPIKHIDALDGASVPNIVDTYFITDSAKMSNNEYACLYSHFDAIRKFSEY